MKLPKPPNTYQNYVRKIGEYAAREEKIRQMGNSTTTGVIREAPPKPSAGSGG
jgi:hypothetical protein